MKTPDEILGLFERHWTATEDELEEALEAFFEDIADSYRLAVQNQYPDRDSDEIHNTVEGYVSNHYFS